MSEGRSSKKTATSHHEDRIRRRAYELWQAEGAPHGRAEDHWHRARRELFGGNDMPDEASSPASTTLDATMGAGEAMARGEPGVKAKPVRTKPASKPAGRKPAPKKN